MKLTTSNVEIKMTISHRDNQDIEDVVSEVAANMKYLPNEDNDIRIESTSAVKNTILSSINKVISEEK